MELQCESCTSLDYSDKSLYSDFASHSAAIVASKDKRYVMATLTRGFYSVFLFTALSQITET